MKKSTLQKIPVNTQDVFILPLLFSAILLEVLTVYTTDISNKNTLIYSTEIFFSFLLIIAGIILLIGSRWPIVARIMISLVFIVSFLLLRLLIYINLSGGIMF